MKFGKVISSFRQRYAVEQKPLAEAAKISVNYLSLIENDKRKPSMAVLASIAAYFGVPVSVLIYEALKGSGMKPKNADKKIFDAAEPMIAMLLEYLTDGKGKQNISPKARLKKPSF